MTEEFTKFWIRFKNDKSIGYENIQETKKRHDFEEALYNYLVKQGALEND